MQRLSPAGSLSLPHKTLAHTAVGDYTFPPGSIFMTNLAFIMRDPEHFHNPSSFTPDRLIGPDGWYGNNQDNFSPTLYYLAIRRMIG